MSSDLIVQPATALKNKARNRGVTNVNRKLLTEFQALIAYACYDSPSISLGGESMKEATLEKIMSSLCFGNDDTANADIVCYVDQFLLGLNWFDSIDPKVSILFDLFVFRGFNKWDCPVCEKSRWNPASQMGQSHLFCFFQL